MPQDPVTQYCTRTDVETRYSREGVEGSLTDYLGTGTEAVPIADPIDEASAKCDLYLGSRYSPQQLARSRLVSMWCVSLALYFIVTRRGDPAPPGVRKRYERALKDMEAVRDGEMALPLGDPAAKPEPAPEGGFTEVPLVWKTGAETPDYDL